MKLLTITDLHGQAAVLERILKAAGEVDAILMGGDLTTFGEPEDAMRLVRQAQAIGPPVWAVAGNCDSARIDQELAELGISLQGRGLVVQGIGLHGLSAMPLWRGDMYQFSEEELASLLAAGYAQIAGAACHVVLSHAPPRGVCDRTRFFQHVGSTALRAFIERTQPALVLCGHIHEARGVDRIGSTVVANCGAALAGFYAIAEVNEAAEVKVELRRAQ